MFLEFDLSMPTPMALPYSNKYFKYENMFFSCWFRKMIHHTSEKIINIATSIKIKVSTILKIVEFNGIVLL